MVPLTSCSCCPLPQCCSSPHALLSGVMVRAVISGPCPGATGGGVGKLAPVLGTTRLSAVIKSSVKGVACQKGTRINEKRVYHNVHHKHKPIGLTSSFPLNVMALSCVIEPSTS